jgi:hypothetical protein
LSFAIIHHKTDVLQRASESKARDSVTKSKKGGSIYKRAVVALGPSLLKIKGSSRKLVDKKAQERKKSRKSSKSEYQACLSPAFESPSTALIFNINTGEDTNARTISVYPNGENSWFGCQEIRQC